MAASSASWRPVMRLRCDEIGWKPPQIITVKARDGVTDLWGLMYSPSHLDPAKKYPVIVHIYPARRSAASEYGASTRAAAARITGWPSSASLSCRSTRSARRTAPRRFTTPGTATWATTGSRSDRHGAAARRAPPVDRHRPRGHLRPLGRRLLVDRRDPALPDFFKVAVSTAGNHDNRSYGSYWAEQYQGLLERDTVRNTDNYMNQVNAELAGNLKGKLFLMHGDMDDNVHPAMTIQVVDALIKANKTSTC
jgi:dipeptidyl-peptidase 4